VEAKRRLAVEPSRTLVVVEELCNTLTREGTSSTASAFERTLAVPAM
jgi:hypothetical protein